MVTLHTYPDSIQAGPAKSILEGHGICCCLADGNANANTAAKFAIPIRLLVAEDQVQDALKILAAR